jgi:Leucine-rich repeat (LRR) protein
VGLAHLKGLTRLEFLRLAHTPISGAGFAHLEGLTRLQWLDLSGTKITDAGVEHLKQSLPNLTITKDQAK